MVKKLGRRALLSFVCSVLQYSCEDVRCAYNEQRPSRFDRCFGSTVVKLCGVLPMSILLARMLVIVAIVLFSDFLTQKGKREK